MSELKNCPFCDSSKIIVQTADYETKSGWDSVECAECGCEIMGGDVEQWNTRASGWISVNERLPVNDDAVLVTDGDNVFTCMYNPWTTKPEVNIEQSYDWFSYHDVPNWGSERCQVYGVTHWMPLPEVPNEHNT